MPDVRVMGDVVAPIKDALGSFWAAAARVADEVPRDWAVDTDPALIVVNDDGGRVDWPVMSFPIARITVYANGKQTARWYRKICMGVLLGSVPPGLAHIRRTGIGYTEARDPDTGADLASFTVTATVRTEVITV